jgi:hypothetical protein
VQALPRLGMGSEYQDTPAAEVLLSGAFPALRHGFRTIITV